MLKNIAFFLHFLYAITICSAQVENDGPYIFIKNGDLIKKEVRNGNVSTAKIDTKTYDTLFSPNNAVYTHVKKIAALSDIHGQYDLAVQLLKNNKIIDQQHNWNFGKGHLVIVGDIFDRGDKVNEILWLIFNLEQQAEQKGGKVHFLMGNHEYMVLHNDLRYVHKKYSKVCELLNLSYPELYGKNTVLGRWLRSKHTLVKINDNVFVHGGISKEFLAHNDFDISQINIIMRQSLERTKAEMKITAFYKIYYGTNSLIWYRGYFNDNLPEIHIDELLKEIESKHIIVGHCSNEKIVSLYNNKIFGVDSSIKLGKYGELLLIKNNKYYRLTLEGKKERFKN